MANPVRDNVAISYTTLLPGRVSVKVYDRTGRLIQRLVDGVVPEGTKTVNWNTSGIANGVYFLRLEAEGNVATHRLVLIK